MLSRKLRDEWPAGLERDGFSRVVQGRQGRGIEPLRKCHETATDDCSPTLPISRKGLQPRVHLKLDYEWNRDFARIIRGSLCKIARVLVPSTGCEGNAPGVCCPSALHNNVRHCRLLAQAAIAERSIASRDTFLASECDFAIHARPSASTIVVG